MPPNISRMNVRLRIARLLLAIIFFLPDFCEAVAQPHYYAPAKDGLVGFGPEFANGGLSSNAPMAYGLFASAFARDYLIDDARRAADWLVENRDLNGDGITGWGLSFAWDAFGDGSVNPAHTVYGITVACAVQGLLDVYRSTQSAIYLTTAEAALESYSRHFYNGAFWYSEAASDRKSIYNVTAMLMGQYVRAARITGRPKFAEIAGEAYAYLMSKANIDSEVLSWSYGEDYPKTNDLVHAAYMTRGLIDYGAPAGVIQRSLNYLHLFARNGALYEFIDRDTHLARVWGLGAALNVACELKDTDLKTKIEAVLPDYRTDDIYLLRPNAGSYSPRLQAHVAWGFSRCRP